MRDRTLLMMIGGRRWREGRMERIGCGCWEPACLVCRTVCKIASESGTLPGFGRWRRFQVARNDMAGGRGERGTKRDHHHPPRSPAHQPHSKSPSPRRRPIHISHRSTSTHALALAHMLLFLLLLLLLLSGGLTDRHTGGTGHTK